MAHLPRATTLMGATFYTSASWISGVCPRCHRAYAAFSSRGPPPCCGNPILAFEGHWPPHSERMAMTETNMNTSNLMRDRRAGTVARAARGVECGDRPRHALPVGETGMVGGCAAMCFVAIGRCPTRPRKIVRADGFFITAIWAAGTADG